ncbi:MAG: hypothetical protein ACRECZ_07070 [Methylocella sp.]
MAAHLPGEAHEPSIDVTWDRAAKVWWSFMWRWLLFMTMGWGLVGFVIGFGFVMGGRSASRQTVTILEYCAGTVVSIPIGIWVVRHVLKKSWSDFRIMLVPKRPSDQN